MSFEFMKDIPVAKSVPVEKTKEYQRLADRTPELVKQLIKNSQGYDEIAEVLRTYHFKWKNIDFPKESIIITRINDIDYVIKDFDDPQLEQSSEWLWKINDWNLNQYIPSDNFSEKFWDEVNSSSILYHATSEENKDSILMDGIRSKNESRGISNRGTGASVFASDNPRDIGSYGNVIFIINLGLMKRDGYMPEVSQEKPISMAEQRNRLANVIGLKDFDAGADLHSEGVYSSTVIIYGDIPPKYLEIYELV